MCAASLGCAAESVAVAELRVLVSRSGFVRCL